MKARAYQIQLTARGIEGRGRKKELRRKIKHWSCWQRWRRRKCHGFTYLRKQITQVFFPALPHVFSQCCNLCCHAHTCGYKHTHTIQSHQLAQALLNVLVCKVWSPRLELFLAASFSHFIPLLCYEYLQNNTDVTADVCQTCLMCHKAPSHPASLNIAPRGRRHDRVLAD